MLPKDHNSQLIDVLFSLVDLCLHMLTMPEIPPIVQRDFKPLNNLLIRQTACKPPLPVTLIHRALVFGTFPLLAPSVLMGKSLLLCAQLL